MSSRKLRNPLSDKLTYSPAETKKRREIITKIVETYIKTNQIEFENFKQQLNARAAYTKTRWGELDPRGVDFLERMSLSLPEKLMNALDVLDPRLFTDISDPKEEDWFVKEFPVFTFGHYTARGKHVVEK